MPKLSHFCEAIEVNRVEMIQVKKCEHRHGTRESCTFLRQSNEQDFNLGYHPTERQYIPI